MDELLLYSEWLDSNGLLNDPLPGDDRTHAILVGQFLAERYPDERQ